MTLVDFTGGGGETKRKHPGASRKHKSVKQLFPPREDNTGRALLFLSEVIHSLIFLKSFFFVLIVYINSPCKLKYRTERLVRERTTLYLVYIFVAEKVT